MNTQPFLPDAVTVRLFYLRSPGHLWLNSPASADTVDTELHEYGVSDVNDTLRTLTLTITNEARMKKLTHGTFFSLLFAALLFAGCADDTAQETELGTEEDTTEMAAPMTETTGDTLSATLTGDAEVPEPGDPDGSGTAEVVLNPQEGTVCFTIEVENIAEAGATHIHSGAPGTAGPPVVDFDVPNNGLSGCADADASTIEAIQASPSQYYVNVHNAEYGGGAVRGQLESGGGQMGSGM